MAAFPFLNLPPSLSDRILKRLDYGELFDLSQCSKRTFNLVKNFGFKNPSGLVVTIQPSSEFKLFGTTYRRRATWVFHHQRDPVIMDLENPRTYNIKDLGLQMDFCINHSTPGSVEFACVSRHCFKDMLKFVQYLVTLFNGSVALINIKNDQMKFLNDILAIDAFRRVRQVSIDGKVTHGELQKVLKSFIAEEFYLLCKTKKNFSIDQPVKCNKFRVLYGNWVNLQTLLKLDCAIVKIFDTSLTNEDLNKFLKRWLEGSDNKLEYIVLTGPSFTNERKLDLPMIADGLPSTPGVPKRPDATNFSLIRFTIPYENGVDLRRADGMRATAVVFMDNFRTEHFLFVVWHVPNPDLVVVG